MPVRMKRADLEWLAEVRRLGMSGLNQTEIAAEIGESVTTLRNRVANLGFQFVGLNDVRATLGGASLEALLERGDLVAADPDPQPTAPAQEPCAA